MTAAAAPSSPSSAARSPSPPAPAAARPRGNARLRLGLLKARESNMPFDIIDRAIKKAVGESDASQLDDVVYEGYAPGAAPSSLRP